MDFEKELKNYMGAIVKYSNQMYLESTVSDIDDLMQAGTMGMINGLRSFSEERAAEAGTKKTTYVIQCIRNAILQEANKFYGPLSLPHNKRLRLNAFKKLVHKGVSREDIKTAMKMTDTEYNDLVAITKVAKVVPVPDTMIDAQSAIENNELDLSSLLEDVDLTDDEKQLLKFKLSGLTYSQIAEHYGLSRETMRKRVHKVWAKIRKKANNG